MKKSSAYLLGVFLLLSFNSHAALKFWSGPNNGLWSNPANWTGGLPGANDEAVFFTGVTVNVDIDPNIGALQVAGGVNVIFSSTSDRLITIGNNSTGGMVFLVDVSSTLTLGQGSAVSIQTYGAGISNTATIGYDATLFLGAGNSRWIIAPFYGSASNCITDVYNRGTLEVAANNTGTVFTGAGVNNLVFSSGSTLNWKRNGGPAPAADYQNGSLIDVTGVTSSMLAFNTSSFYNGLIRWNCASQTISGSSAVMLPSASAVMDSIRVVNTGTGSLRLSTDPVGYSIGHLEVQGGTLQMSSPVSGFRTGSIATDLKISGGTVFGNATFAGDNVAQFPMTLTVNRNFTMTGGTFNLTNRTLSPGPAGAFQMNVVGHVSQSAGTVTASTAFGSQNYIMMNGVASQNLELDNITGPASLIINNSAGVILQDDVSLPYALVLLSGILTSSVSNLLTIQAGAVVPFASNTSFVDGPVKKIGNTAFTFPVGKPNCGPSATVNGYAALEISNFTGGAATDQFTAEYKRGDAMSLGSISNPMINHFSRCDYWTLVRDIATTSTVNITLSWDEPVNNCITAAPYINNLPSLAVAHNNNTGSSTWDTYSVANVTSGTATTGTVTWDAGSPQSNTFGAFAIASLDVNNPLTVIVNYFKGAKQNGDHLLSWKLNCSSTTSVMMELERSTDRRNYTGIYTLTATSLQCQQPFNYTDNHPAAGINYYRLKMTDANGKVFYTSIVSLINANKGIDISAIAPNPVVNGNFNLDISAAQKTGIDIIISDMQGRVVQKRSISMIAGFNTIRVNVGKLAKGTYQLYGNSAGERTGVLRFVIQ